MPRVGSNDELPLEFRSHDKPKEVVQTMDQRRGSLRRFDSMQTRMQWRETMDRSLRRLMQDMELARDDRLKASADKVRCDHLDKVYEWYSKNGMKEMKRDRPAQPYVR